MRFRARLRVTLVLAATIFAATSCARSRDCKTLLEPIRGLDDKDLLRFPEQSSDVAPIVSYFDGVRAGIEAARSKLSDDAVQSLADRFDKLVSARIGLLHAARFDAGKLDLETFEALDQNKEAIQHLRSDDYFAVCR
jgi:hypothetical protein